MKKMAFLKKYITEVLTAVFVIASVLMFYAPMFAYQEGLQIFMFNREFLIDTCLRPGGLSDYLGCFFVQFFMYPHWLVVILTLLILGILCLLESIFVKYADKNFAKFLGFLCALGMFAVVTDFAVLFGGVIAVLLSLVAVKINSLTSNVVIFSILTPIIYWLAGGWCCLLYILGSALNFPIKKGGVLGIVNVLILVFSFLITKNLMQDDGFKETFAGVDYNRYPENFRYIWFVELFIIAVCMVLSRIKITLEKNIVKIPLYVVAFLGLFAVMIAKYNPSAMYDFKIDKLVRYKHWNEIIEISSKSGISTPLSECYLNIALNELGMLDSKMFSFIQIGTEGLASLNIDNQAKSIVNGEIYFRLGLMNTAERLSIDAMEGCNTFQKSARQYKRLAEIAIIRDDKPLAIRYLRKLQATVFYSAWADKAEKYLNTKNEKEALADWKMKPLIMKYDFFFGSNYGSELFFYLLGNQPQNRKLFNYYTCYLLLEKKIAQLYKFIGECKLENPVGKHIYEALLLYISKNRPQEFEKMLAKPDALTQRFQSFSSFMSSGGGSDFEKARQLFGDTYWFYYFFAGGQK